MLAAASSRPLLHRIADLCIRLAHDFRDAGSPWQRVPMNVPATAFGPGSRCAFASYFEGESRVAVTSIGDIVGWLAGCAYVSDMDQFQVADHWQPPLMFEASRRGDCEDFALWAWRKLAEIGVEAELFVGRVVCDDCSGRDRQHAWVVYRVRGEEFLFEPAAGSAREMIQPLDDVRDDYVPHFAVNQQCVTSAFAGCLLDRGRFTRRTDETSG
jgi:Bacterial transglutaminase-like cysteine proteinase BTLCP